MQRILVVDDDEQLLASLASILKKAEYDVETASHGGEALKSIERHLPDLILTDILMPEREGIELILEARRRWPGLKIVAMSGGGMLGAGQVNFLEAAKRLGADASLAKPFKPQQLLSLISDVLRRDVSR